jgi:hypothetical protein
MGQVGAYRNLFKKILRKTRFILAEAHGGGAGVWVSSQEISFQKPLVSPETGALHLLFPLLPTYDRERLLRERNLFMVSDLVPSLSYAARRELIARTSPLYREASLAQKGLLLDRIVAVTGYARKYAIRLFNQAPQCTSTIYRRREPRYGPEIRHALLLAWKAAKYICAKRLIPFLPTLVPALERHGYLHLTEES